MRIVNKIFLVISVLLLLTTITSGWGTSDSGTGFGLVVLIFILFVILMVWLGINLGKTYSDKISQPTINETPVSNTDTQSPEAIAPKSARPYLKVSLTIGTLAALVNLIGLVSILSLKTKDSVIIQSVQSSIIAIGFIAGPILFGLAIWGIIAAVKAYRLGSKKLAILAMVLCSGFLWMPLLVSPSQDTKTRPDPYGLIQEAPTQIYLVEGASERSEIDAGKFYLKNSQLTNYQITSTYKRKSSRATDETIIVTNMRLQGQIDVCGKEKEFGFKCQEVAKTKDGVTVYLAERPDSGPYYKFQYPDNRVVEVKYNKSTIDYRASQLSSAELQDFVDSLTLQPTSSIRIITS